MESKGFMIHAIVCDLGNPTLLKQLKFHKTKKNKKRWFYFVHPLDPSRRVYIIADGPHMLKLLRNHFLDDGFKIPASDGKKIIDGPLVTFTKEDIEPLIESKNEIKMLFKLRRFHLDVKQSERQRVRPAAELFSNSVACAIMYGKSPQDPDYHDCLAKSYAIKLVNDWFDVMNSKNFDYRNRLKTPFGQHEDILRDQMDVLNRMDEFLNKLEVMSSAPQKWIDGIQNSIKSTKMLFKDLVVGVDSPGPFKYILTARLNQDCLENLFSKLRAMGGPNDHPGPVRFMKRLRMMLLGKENFI